MGLCDSPLALGPHSGTAWLCPVGRDRTTVPLQSGSALKRTTPSRQQMPRRAPSHPCSASGIPARLCASMTPDRGVMLSPRPPCFAGAGPAAFRRQPLATPTQPTSSSRGSPTRGCQPPVPAKPTTSRWRARPGASSARAPLGHEYLCHQRKSDGAAGISVCQGGCPMDTHAAPLAWAGRRDPNRPSW